MEVWKWYLISFVVIVLVVILYYSIEFFGKVFEWILVVGMIYAFFKFLKCTFKS